MEALAGATPHCCSMGRISAGEPGCAVGDMLLETRSKMPAFFRSLSSVVSKVRLNCSGLRVGVAGVEIRHGKTDEWPRNCGCRGADCRLSVDWGWTEQKSAISTQSSESMRMPRQSTLEREVLFKLAIITMLDAKTRLWEMIEREDHC